MVILTLTIIIIHRHLKRLGKKIQLFRFLVLQSTQLPPQIFPHFLHIKIVFIFQKDVKTLRAAQYAKLRALT